MADGTVIRTGGRNVKDVAGLLADAPVRRQSRGRSAITTEATLRLRPAPPPRSTMLAFFPTLEAAGDGRRRDRRRRPVAGHPRAAWTGSRSPRSTT